MMGILCWRVVCLGERWMRRGVWDNRVRVEGSREAMVVVFADGWDYLVDEIMRVGLQLLRFDLP